MANKKTSARAPSPISKKLSPKQEALYDARMWFELLDATSAPKDILKALHRAMSKGDLTYRDLDPTHNETECHMQMVVYERYYAAWLRGAKQTYGRLATYGDPDETVPLLYEQLYEAGAKLTDLDQRPKAEIKRVIDERSNERRLGLACEAFAKLPEVKDPAVQITKIEHRLDKAGITFEQFNSDKSLRKLLVKAMDGIAKPIASSHRNAPVAADVREAVRLEC